MPVIWATQVLESLAKEGDLPRDRKLADAAMGERAECVMLNKGPYAGDIRLRAWGYPQTHAGSPGEKTLNAAATSPRFLPERRLRTRHAGTAEPQLPLTLTPCRIRTPIHLKGYRRICPQFVSSLPFLLLELSRCYGSQLTRERRHTKTQRHPDSRPKHGSSAGRSQDIRELLCLLPWRKRQRRRPGRASLKDQSSAC